MPGPPRARPSVLRRTPARRRARPHTYGVTAGRIGLVTALVLLCAATAPAVSPSRPSQAPVSLAALPSSQLAKCMRSLLLRPVCPRRVPRVSGRYRALLARDGNLAPALQVFDLERFSPSLRPPEGSHVTVAAGAVWRLTPYARPDETLKGSAVSHPVNVNRSKPVSFGVRRWNARRGVLYPRPHTFTADS